MKSLSKNRIQLILDSSCLIHPILLMNSSLTTLQGDQKRKEALGNLTVRINSKITASHITK
jgi:hypothetical protein